MSLVAALAQVVGVQVAASNVAEERLKICSGCEFKKTALLGATEVCGVCGCPLGNKARIATSTCPKGKW